MLLIFLIIMVVLPGYDGNRWYTDTGNNSIVQSAGSSSLGRYDRVAAGGADVLTRSFRAVEETSGKIDGLSQVLRRHIENFRLDTDKMEIVFLVDASSSVGQENFQSELNFIRKLLSDLTVEQTATRVALVTFAGKGMISRNIDQITSPKFAGDKCRLLNDELRQIKYSGGGTYTRGALLEALTILRASRPGAKKVVFLITDGFSNGGDPRPVAGILKDLGAIVLTFGIRTGNVEELKAIASEPGNTHSYLLDSFKEFEALARHALHRDLKEGSYSILETRNACKFLCNVSDELGDNQLEQGTLYEGNCCDELAECSCGRASGHYACLCPVGYYGSGLIGNCHPCPNGTYGVATSPGDATSNCVQCPNPNHITLKIPAISPRDCFCASGFITDGMNCQAITCPKLNVPENGYLVKASACNNMINAACGLRCRIGFRLIGDSIRLCRNDGQWSGSETQCILKTCPVLKAPVHGEVDCEYDEEDYDSLQPPKLDPLSLPIDAKCQFKCGEGYQLLGSKVRYCLPVSRWDGLKVTCKQIKCEPLKHIPNGQITPEACLGPKKLPFGTNCSISCAQGYALEGPATRKCAGTSGVWSKRHSVTRCVDKTPPVIICPKDSTWEALPGKRYSLPTWDPPIVSDNDHKNVRVWTKPHLKQPWKARIGKHLITYIAQDAAGNKARCRFSMTTIDKEPPRVEHCVDPPTFLSTNPNGAENVTWDDPVFHDNSKKAVIISRSHDQGTLFPVGTTAVTYKALDPSKNVAECVINITVQNVCEEPPFLLNGQLKCSGDASNGKQCVITCDEGYVFPLEPTNNVGDPILFCSDQSFWNESLPSSCSLTEIPESVESTGSIILESNHSLCSDADLLEHLKTGIHKDLLVNLPHSCGVNGLDCRPTDVEVNCTDSYPQIKTIRKRAVDTKNPKKKRDRVEIKFKFITKIIAENKKDPQRGIQKLRTELLTLTKSGKLNLLNERTNREIANLALNIKTLFSNEVKEVCEPGRVMRKYKCARCPTGTFHNTAKDTCQPCKLSEYQDTQGSTFCKKCPRGMSTRRIHSINRHDCVRICSPGYYSKRRYHRDQKMSLEPCIRCGIGFYQPLAGKTSCIPCPQNMTTDTLGATDSRQCRAIDPPDYCEPDSCLNGGVCSSDGFGFTCDCPEGFVGSRCEEMRNPCESVPCLNEGACYPNRNQTHYYICYCPPGFTGANCETYIDECSSQPCQNNGTCVSTENDFHCRCPDGFTGEFCEVLLDICQPGVCEEGSTCVVVNGTWNCLCKPGFLGRHCHLLPCDWLPCHPNAICVNLEKPNATNNSYRCECPPGFTGEDCGTRIDYCSSSPCQNSGTCIRHLRNFTCECPLGYDGSRCEVKLPSDFVLSFVEPGTTDFVMMEGPRMNLSEFSICFWIQSRDTFNYGTVFSYATSSGDNTITLTDYNGLVLYVNGDKVVTDISLNDGSWHFLCVTWKVNGSWFIYVDGELRESGENLSAGREIPANGTIVIGQEQDYPKGGFSASESFLGRLTLLDVWKTYLSAGVIRNFGTTCEIYSGNLIPWSSTMKNVHGNIRKVKSPLCRGCPEPNAPPKGFVRLSDDGNAAVYTCESGYQFYQNYKPQATLTRKCLKQSQWEGLQEPICSRVLCGFPGYFPRGRVIGNSFYFGDEIYYSCDEGYELRGNPHRVCNSEGRWSGKPPMCIGITCRNLLAPANGDVDYILEEHERDDTSIIQVGQQLAYKCNFGFKLIGEKILTCLKNGQWDHKIPKCEAIGCLLPDPTDHKHYKINSNISEEEKINLFNFGDVLEINCDAGYEFVDHSQNSLTCSEKGMWKGNVSDCQPVKCPSPQILNGFVNNNTDDNEKKYSVGENLVFQCNQGFRSSEEPVICQESGNWSSTAQCTPIRCPSISNHPVASLFFNKPSSPLKLDPETQSRIHKFTLAIEGDKLGDNLILRCSDQTKDLIINGTKLRNICWRCEEQWRLQNININDTELRTLLLSQDLCEGQCPPPIVPANALLITQNVTDWRPNATISYECQPGYVLQGLGSAICTSSGSWSGMSLCRPIVCPGEPPRVNNAEFNLDSKEHTFGKTITYRCHPGYRMYGPKTSKCLASGRWSRVLGKCSKISCGKPKVADDVKLEGKSYLYQEQLGFICKSGKIGNITCLANGQWDTTPAC